MELNGAQAPVVELSIPDQRVIAAYADGVATRQAVDRLDTAGLPVQRVIVVGRGPHRTEPAVPRPVFGQALNRGAAAGAVAAAAAVGLFDALGLAQPAGSVITAILLALPFGAVIGVLLTGLVEVLRPGRPPTRFCGIDADRYHLLIDADLADAAAEALGSRRPRSVDAEAAADGRRR